METLRGSLRARCRRATGRARGGRRDGAGIVWLPEAATGPRPTVILGHGGVVHKRAPEVLGLARRLVRHQGYAAVALDAPEHGERITDKEAARARRRAVQARVDQGPGAGLPVVMDADQRAGFAAPDGAPTSGSSSPWWTTSPRPGSSTTGWATGDCPWGPPSVSDSWPPNRGSRPPCSVWPAWARYGRGRVRDGGPISTGADPVPPPVGRRVDRPRRRSRSLRCHRLDRQDPPRQPGGHVQVPVFENDSAESFFVRHLGAGQGARMRHSADRRIGVSVDAAMPQDTAFSSAVVWLSPALTSTQALCVPTWIGMRESVVVPSPSWPLWLPCTTTFRHCGSHTCVGRHAVTAFQRDAPTRTGRRLVRWWCRRRARRNRWIPSTTACRFSGPRFDHCGSHRCAGRQW